MAIPLYNKAQIANIEELRTAARNNKLDFLDERDRVMLQQALQVQVRPQENSLEAIQRRPDAPTNKPKLRGNLQKALAAAKPENRDAARKRLMQDIYAQSNIGSRESKWKTWCLIAAEWGHAPIPITKDLAIDAATSFKEGDYRSARQYFHRAKEEHINLTGQELPADIERLVAQVIRSTERGIGPAAFKDSFMLELLRPVAATDNVETATASFLRDNTAAKVDMVILGCWWMTRGLELATAKQVHLWAEVNNNTVFWTLPVDKTHTGGGCITRPHKCCCRARLDTICPYHAACRHLRRLYKAFNFKDMDGQKFENFPLFPNPDGEHLTKSEVISILRSVIALTGTALQRPGPTGGMRDKFGEHVMRVSGAQLMARAGIELYIIQLYGRWGSWAIERYVQEAYLHGQNNVARTVVDNLQDTIEKATGESMETILDHSEKSDLSTDEVMQLIETTIHKVMESQRKFIGNPQTNKAHIPALGEQSVQSAFWHAACGWPYGRRNHVGLSKIEGSWTLCKKCVEAKAYYNQLDCEDD